MSSSTRSYRAYHWHNVSTLASGADSVMLGSLLAGCEESQLEEDPTAKAIKIKAIRDAIAPRDLWR